MRDLEVGAVGPALDARARALRAVHAQLDERKIAADRPRRGDPDLDHGAEPFEALVLAAPLHRCERVHAGLAGEAAVGEVALHFAENARTIGSVVALVVVHGDGVAGEPGPRVVHVEERRHPRRVLAADPNECVAEILGLRKQEDDLRAPHAILERADRFRALARRALEIDAERAPHLLHAPKPRPLTQQLRIDVVGTVRVKLGFDLCQALRPLADVERTADSLDAIAKLLEHQSRSALSFLSAFLPRRYASMNGSRSPSRTACVCEVCSPVRTSFTS
jgi:hypothetical protein